MDTIRKTIIAELMLIALVCILGAGPVWASDKVCPDITPYMEAGAKLISTAPGDAEKIYTEAAMLCPDSCNTYYNLAIARLRQGDFMEAYKHIDKAFRLAPDSTSIKALYISILISGKIDVDKGNDMLRKELATGHDNADIGKAKVASLLQDAVSVGSIFSPLMALEGRKNYEMGNYIVNLNDGTVDDPHSGIMWEYQNDEYLTYPKAMKYCENLKLGPFDDWTLPNRKQMETLVVKGKTPRRSKPMFDAEIFPRRLVKRYWMIEKAEFNHSYGHAPTTSPQALTFNMERAKVAPHDMDSKKHVWCVRTSGK